MNDLNKYLKENRNVIDDCEPFDGHCERFEERLNSYLQEKKRRRNLTVKLCAAVAAAASIVIIVTGIWMYKSSGDEDSAERNFSEFMETETFYRRQMEEQIAVINCKLSKADAETRIQLEKDLQDIVEDAGKFAEEIHEAESEELAIYYLVEHYTANLEALQAINGKLGEYYKC
ncbi:MAG: hypothetical protein LBK97_00080 [Prevotellaceae bacterium]|jgi:hypothetical protein|nr:hypothetical protein [Prevotellaceae bacterium]